MDCAFQTGEGLFRYRACAIIIEDESVLMAKNDRDPYYYSVGRGVHQNESAEDAVRREVLEETGVAYEIDRLAFVHENFFIGSEWMPGVLCHEVSLYFLMKPQSRREFSAPSWGADGVKGQNFEFERFIFQTFPSFFAEKLPPKDGVEHIVTREY